MIGKIGCLEAPAQLETGKCNKLDDLTTFALRQFIEHIVAQVFQVTQSDLQRHSRGRASVAFARQVAMYLGHVTFGISMHDVGEIFGRDRTTVAHACAVIEDARDDPGFDFTMDLLAFALLPSVCGGDEDCPVAK